MKMDRDFLAKKVLFLMVPSFISTQGRKLWIGLNSSPPKLSGLPGTLFSPSVLVHSTNNELNWFHCKLICCREVNVLAIVYQFKVGKGMVRNSNSVILLEM